MEYPPPGAMIIAAPVFGLMLVMGTCVGWRTTEGGRLVRYKITAPSDNRDDIHRQGIQTIGAYNQRDDFSHLPVRASDTEEETTRWSQVAPA